MSLPANPKVAGWHAFKRAVSIKPDSSACDGNGKEILDVAEPMLASQRSVMGGHVGFGFEVGVAADSGKGTEPPHANVAMAA